MIKQVLFSFLLIISYSITSIAQCDIDSLSQLSYDEPEKALIEIYKLEQNSISCPNFDRDEYALVKAQAYYFTFNMDSAYYYNSLVYKRTTNEDFKIEAISGMAKIHSFWNDHQKAVYMLENELQKPSITTKNKNEIYNALCRGLFGLNQHKKAIPYLLLSLEYSEAQKDSSDMIVHLNNLGNAYYDIGELDSALTVLNKAKKLNEKVKSRQTKISLALTIAMVNHTKFATEESIKEFKEGMHTAIKEKWYPYALDAAEYLHDYYKKEIILDSAYTYLLLQNQLKDSLDGENIKLQAIENKIEYEEERYELLSAKLEKEAQLYEAQIKSDRRLRYFLISVLILIIVVWGTLLLRKQSRIKQNALLLEQKILNEQLSKKEQELLSSTLSIAGRSKYIDELKESINSISNETEIEKVEKIKQDLKNVERFDLAWKRVRVQMDNTYPNFIAEIEKKHPGISDQDIQMCTFIKLKMSTNDIATLLNLQKRTIQTKKYRLKKRLKIETNLPAYICSFGNENS